MVEKYPDSSWTTRGKKISQLKKELGVFEDEDLFVELSIDGGDTVYPISLVGKQDGKCVLFFVKDSPNLE